MERAERILVSGGLRKKIFDTAFQAAEDESAAHSWSANVPENGSFSLSERIFPECPSPVFRRPVPICDTAMNQVVIVTTAHVAMPK
jgi:hypothetical protein